MQIAWTRFKRLGPHKEVIRIVMTLDLAKVTPSDLEILTQTFAKKGGITRSNTPVMLQLHVSL